MDSKEMYNPGDDGKLLMSASPAQTSRFIYGMEDDELVVHLGKWPQFIIFYLLLYVFTLTLTFQCHLFSDSVPHSNVIVLFPSDYAISFPDWIASLLASGINAPSGCLAGTAAALPPGTELTVIAVDAVWRHARRMATRLREILPKVRHVQLTPEQMSVYARKQTQPDRICTVEATALFLSLCGEQERTCEAMVECVRINNAALRPEAKTEPLHKALYTDDVPHPAWYLGINMVGDVGSEVGSLTKKCNRAPRSKGKRYL